MVDFPSKDRYVVEDLRALVEALRGEGGCPWDREQTHESLRRGMLEEACELCEAIDEGNGAHLREELGDVLLQVVFHASIEAGRGAFDLDDVADAECRKLILRHPHLFGDVKVTDSDEVLRNWDAIKRVEKAQATTADAMRDVSKTLPALWRAEKLQKKTAKTGFDWNNVGQALDKLAEELSELREGIGRGDRENILEEMGDLLYCAVNVCRFTDTDPEAALHGACEKAISRMRAMENGAAALGARLEDLPLETQTELYQAARVTLEGKEPPAGFQFTTVTPPLTAD